MSTVYNIGPNWVGFDAIRRLVIFGDSYSSVEDIPSYEEKPNANQPLGVAFPGFTYNECDLPNWVGHLITKYCPEPRYNPDTAKQDDAWIKSPLLVYDYAKGGERVAGVGRQIERLFLPGVGKKPTWATGTLFVTWVGINDCAFIHEPDVMDKLFAHQEKLYSAGARNFLFIDVPTIHRIPLNRQTQVLTKFEIWNANLRLAIEQFGSQHPDASLFLFSAFKAFDKLLDDPEKFGFKAEDARRRGGSIWMDHIHPTSKVHDYIASNVASFLQEIKPEPSSL